MIRKAEINRKEHLQGGKGGAVVHTIVPEKDLYNSGRMYSKIILDPGASVGWHRHEGETEPYYILEGRGVFIDDDGSRSEVAAGDVCTILPGQCHSLENSSETDPLTFIALIYNDLR